MQRVLPEAFLPFCCRPRASEAQYEQLGQVLALFAQAEFPPNKSGYFQWQLRQVQQNWVGALEAFRQQVVLGAVLRTVLRIVLRTVLGAVLRTVLWTLSGYHHYLLG